MSAANFNYSSLNTLVLFALVGTVMGMNAIAASDSETVIFRKALDRGRELLVVRGPNRPKEDVVDLIPMMDPSVERNNPGEYFSLRLELHSPGKDIKGEGHKGDRRIY